jgi:lipoyl(octanoyl) transferase
MITLCGIQGARPTSLSAEAGRDITIEEAKHVFAQEFGEAFADSAVAADQAPQE